jgi:uncharacterized lipoprotein NlpE involved in copper resistance
MKPLWIATAVLAATLALTGCKNRKQEPVPAPNAVSPTALAQAPSAAGTAAPTDTAPTTSGQHGAATHYRASGISWFQGTLEEAFSTTCHCASMFRH